MQKIGFCERYMLTTAVLKRFKTNTRRLEKELERLVANYEKQYCEPFRLIEQKWDGTNNRLVLYAHTGIADTDREHVLTLKTRYKLGEVVAVAQAYKDVFTDDDLIAFDDGLEIKLSKGWNNKLFVKPDLMKHQIQMTDVRIERLQAISDDDCLKEGVYYDADVDGYKVFNLSLPNKGWEHKFRQTYFKTPREAFAALINRPGVGRKGLWQSNPFVVVYEFRLIK